jgi:hypothetical protein
MGKKKQVGAIDPRLNEPRMEIEWKDQGAPPV